MLTVFMEDSERAAGLAKENQVDVPREADYLMSDEFSELLQRLENRSKLCLRTRQFYFRVHQILALKLIQRKLIEMN
jgi:hypothetical protein